jgi:16S rRNA (adenine(1408)-N(1))-methyltransferase
VIADIGTGDGRAVLARATAEPASLVIGVDAAAGAMAETSRRAARRGPGNAVFLAAGAAELADTPTPLAGRVDLVTITFPWGSLLRGVLGLEPAVLAGIAALVAHGGRIEVLASVVPSDRIDGVGTLDIGWERAIQCVWAGVGMELVSMRPATAAEIAASRSSWAQRLDPARGSRTVWRLDLCRPKP